MTDEITDEMVRAAWTRIAATSDGEIVYRSLQKRLCRVANVSALLTDLTFHEGARSFCAELMGLMSEGIRVRDGVLTFLTAGGKRRNDDNVFRPRPGGRRVDATTYVPGFDGPVDQHADDERPGYTVE